MLAETYPDARCELDFDNPFELLVATVLSRPDHRPAGQRRHARRCSRRTPTRRAMAAADRARARADHPADRLLPGQDRVAAQARRRRSSSGTTARCRRGSRTWSRCPASAARPPTSCSATPSASPASPSTPTSAGWPAGSAGPSETDPVKVEHEVGALFPKQDWTMLSPPPDLARPPDLPRPQPGLRRLPGRALVPVVRRGADRPGRGREAGQDRGAGVRRLAPGCGCRPAAGACVRAPAARPASPAAREHGPARRRRRDTPALRALRSSRPASTGLPGRPAPASERLPDVTLPCLGGGPPVDLAGLRGPMVVNLLAPVVRSVPRRRCRYYQRLHAGGRRTVRCSASTTWTPSRPPRSSWPRSRRHLPAGRRPRGALAGTAAGPRPAGHLVRRRDG